ncbi:hypothetical protein TSUD_383270 [Trifolium subterraneum]|uniref:ABC transmembrane type-1 domain-containing protein n=1 Tax=Trifolium subterraneum TaxID=3900 RepID=A0A2Z6LT33_TRISU|nr:hypothetical protein TSUD_383270 [Trifolium subterraneum]
MLPFYIGAHDELIKDVDGAYSQLIRFQEGEKESQKSEADTSHILNSQNHRISFVKSTSQRSSGRLSRSHRFYLPHQIGVQTEASNIEEGQLENKKRKNVSIRRLANLNKPEIPALLLGSIAAIGNGVVFPIFGLVFSSAITMFYKPPEQQKKDARLWSLLYVGLGLFSLVVLPLQNYFFGVAGGKLVERIRSLTFAKVVHQEISWFDDPANSSGAVGARLSTDASLVKSLVGDTLALIVQNISSITAGLILAFTSNWILAFIVLAVLPVVLIQGIIQMQFLEGFSADAKVMYEEASQVANDAVSSIRTVASFNAESKVMDMYQKKCSGPEKQGSVLVQHGKATFPEVFKVFFSLTITAVGISQSSTLAPDTNKAKDSTASIFEILDSNPTIDSSSNEGVTLETVTDTIAVIKNGAVAEKGRHDALMKIADGVYASLVALHSMANGLSRPLMALIFGKLINTFGSTSPSHIVHEVSKVALLFVYLGIGCGTALFLQVTCWMVTGERQAARIRGLYLKTILKQEISYFDTEATSGEVIGRMSGDTILIQDAISEKVGKFIQIISYFLGGYVIAFTKGWELSLVLLACVPCFIIIGGFMSMMMAKMSISGQIAYSEAGVVVEQTVGAIKTVASFTGEEKAIEKYHKKLKIAYNSTVQQGLAIGTGMGLLLLIVIGTNAFAMWYGSKLIIEKGYNGTHDELIKDPFGAYSQLISLQEGTMEAKESHNSETDESKNSFNLDSHVTRTSFEKSISQGSSRTNDDFESSELDNVKWQKVSIKRLAKLNKPEVPVLLLGSIAAAVHGVIFPIAALFLSLAVNTFYEPPEKLRKDSEFWSLLSLGLGFITLVAISVQNYLFGISGGKLIERIRSLTFNKVVHQEISWFDHPSNSSDAVCARLATDASTVRTLIGDTLALIVQNTATVTAGLVLAFSANWILSFVVLSVSSLLLIHEYIKTKFLKGFSAEAKVKYEEASQVANDAVGSIRTVASFCAEQKMMDMYQKKCSAPEKQGVRLGLISVTVVSVSKTLAVAPDTNKARDSTASIFEILDSKPTIGSSNNDGTILETVKAVVKNGVIAENGTHDLLMEIDGGVYASLVALHISAS